MSSPSTQQLQRAIQIAEQIEQLEQELRNVLNGATATVVEAAPEAEEPRMPAKRGRKKG